MKDKEVKKSLDLGMFKLRLTKDGRKQIVCKEEYTGTKESDYYNFKRLYRNVLNTFFGNEDNN
jgi:hypothetical protein